MQGLHTAEWARARAAALARDQHCCQARERYGPLVLYCHETVGVHVHHVDPDGAPYDLGNLVTLCPVHHARLHHRDPKLADRRPRRARANAAAYRRAA